MKGAIQPRGAQPVKIKTGDGFKKFRILILLLVLLGVALDAWLTKVRSTGWDRPLRVVVYPIAADAGEEVAGYLPTLSNENFKAIDEYFHNEAQRYKIALKNPMDVHLGPMMKELPPLPPVKGNILEIMWWSLKLRYWAMVMDEYDGPRPDIRVFVLYHILADNKRLPHSTGLQKGMLSVVHAFADRRLAESNNVVITHELLHTLGATDKYDLATGMPIYPLGFAEPDKSPRYPQRWAEIMGGYIPVSETKAEQPRSLAETLVGETTAIEIGWRASH
ncbi:MAG: hypothetical protein HY272_05350 [Gammaproteobacteria bacterium]|nr:hypothetical protein [Gammaproteobacteria bacterium]